VTVTLEIPQELEAKLTAQADSRGVSVPELLQAVIASHARVSQTPGTALNLSGEERARAWQEFFDEFDVEPGVGEGTLDRENWYR
jgi:hypothetical protein